VAVDGHEVELTTLEYKLLLTLAERHGRVQSERAAADVWGYHYAVIPAPSILTSPACAPSWDVQCNDRTLRGFGYKLEEE